MCPLNKGSARYLTCVWVVLEVGEGSLENLDFVEVHLLVPMPVRDIVMQFPASCPPCFQGKNSNLFIGITSVGSLLYFRWALANGDAVVPSEGGVAVVAPYNSAFLSRPRGVRPGSIGGRAVRALLLRPGPTTS
jgi:hypothetical protein